MENRKSHTPVNEDAKETMKDKIKRLIESDVKTTQHTA